MLLPLLFCASVAPAADKVRPPNVILILADDMAVGDLSSLNGGRTRTPHLDQLKQESVWFNRAYSGSCVCAPARAALLTGRYPHRTGVVTLNMEKYPDLTRLRTDETTMADVFRANGYVTGIVGKWHLGLGKEYHPLARGFDEFEGFIGATDVRSYFDYTLDIQGERQEFKDRYLTTDLAQRAIAFVQRHREQPFFLHLAHYAPHRPLGAPEERIQRYLDAGVTRQTATVYAMEEILDEGIGELLAELDRLKLGGQTLVVFASDNGPDPVIEQRFNLELRGTKYEVHEGGIRVPFMMRWPGHLKPRETDAFVHFTDVLPTLVELCGLKFTPKLQLDGSSIAGVVRNGGTRPDVKLFWQWNRFTPIYSHNAALRDGQWKLVRPFVTREIPKGESDLPPLLFDMNADPHETTDLASGNPERVQRMNAELEKWCREVEHDRARESK